MDSVQALFVSREDFAENRVIEQPMLAPADGEILLAIDRFAFTANNVTYAETGDSIGYWKFFPAPAGWGAIPVWGFGDVVQSRCQGMAPGERIYGFLPMATHLLLRPERVGPGSFVDALPHRQALPPAYNLYQRCVADPAWRADLEDWQALLRPTFTTSFLIDDWLADEGFFGAGRVLISSASSKTAIGLADLLQRRGGVEVVGLTSRGNVDFVAGLGRYHRVLAYEELEVLKDDMATVYVDFAGSADLRQQVHGQLGKRLVFSSSVGLSHRGPLEPDSSLPGPKPVFFFAPDRLRKRAKDWGREGIEPRVNAQWKGFVQGAREWLTVRHADGAEAVQAAYAEALAGRVPPDTGLMFSLRAAAERAH
jgi:hypothetical protein